MRADPSLVEGWISARSLCRGLPLPAADHGGWRVETGTEAEIRRYVFAASSPSLSDLAYEIFESRIFLKLCGSQAEMRELLPERWRIEPTIFMMTCGTLPQSSSALPPGYTLDLSTTGRVTEARILSPCGELAASGHAAESHGVFIYDRIVVEPDHRRRGLGKALMTALAAARRSSTSRPVLVATAAGEALYRTLGWTLHAPYTTAFIPKD